MGKQTQLALDDAVDWLGDWHPLAEQLGSTDGIATLGSVCAFLCLDPVQDLRSFRKFLRSYHEQMLVPLELPAIQASFSHAERNELRELVDLDQRLARQLVLQSFAAASRRIGQGQLQKLRPLRDVRLVQRYLFRVNTGEAHGWHTLVYGLTLEVYSLPLRQGLLGYAHQTTRSFIYSAARMLRFSEMQCRTIFEEFCAGLPTAVEKLVQQNSPA
ncbi:MAG TPA: urease accessory UreF family protein [Candidatus Limnocylindrales bacterium]|jgi:urease accessory protein UreF|nr:urease accessory UreF family protein [Candidatus Limnocylindrales bacterium]